MTLHPDQIRADVRTAEAMIDECLTSDTLEDRERRIRDAWYAAPAPVRQAFTFCMFSRVAERGRRR